MIERIVITLSLLVCVAFQITFWHYFPDDAYIYLRYAENLSSGNGLVFNPGEPSLGLTGILWALLLSLFRIALPQSIDFVLISKMLGIVLTILQYIVLNKIVSTVHRTFSFDVRSKNALLLLSVLFFSSIPIVFWAGGGLDGPLTCLLILLTLLFYLRERSETKSFVWPTLASLAVASRIDSLIAVCGLLLFEGVEVVRTRVSIRRWLWDSGLLFTQLALFFVGLVLYYGSVFPNSYFSKVVVFSDRSTTHGDLITNFTSYLAPFIGYHLPLLAASLTPLFVLRNDLKKHLMPMIVLGVMLVVPSFILFWYVSDWMPAFRYFSVLLPVLIALSTVQLSVIFSKRVTIFIVVVYVLLQGALFRTTVIQSREYTDRWRPIKDDVVNTVIRLTRDNALVAHNRVGYFPYHYKRACLDFDGLTDPEIARHGFSIDYIYQRNPDVVILLHRKDGQPADWNARLLYADQEFKKRYREAISMRTYISEGGYFGYYINVTSSRVTNVALQSFASEVSHPEFL